MESKAISAFNLVEVEFEAEFGNINMHGTSSVSYAGMFENKK